MDWLLPPDRLAQHALVVVVALLATALSVVIHYRGLHALAKRYAVREPRRDSRAMLTIIFALLGLHLLEIWCYGLAFWGLSMVPDAGFVHGPHGMDTLFDAMYLSATTYTTLGIGDLAPVGAIRFISGLESLVGLLLIAWSASFTYMEMSRLWDTGRASGS
jgi:hypothetical protein